MKLLKYICDKFLVWSIILGFWFLILLFAVVQRGEFIVENFKIGHYATAITPIVIYAVVITGITLVIKSIFKKKK